MFASAWVIRKDLPIPTVPKVEQKLRWLKEHGDDYDVLFIGSSRTHGGIRPEAFDRLAASAGYPCRSFNLGINGMRPPEDTYLLSAALALRHKPIRWVIVEGIEFNVYADSFRGTRRLSYWHDGVRTAAVFRAICEPEPGRKFRFLSSWKRFSNFWSSLSLNAESGLAFSSNLGRGSEALEESLALRTFSPLGTNGEALDGFGLHDDKEKISEKEWEELRGDIAEYVKRPVEPALLSLESQRQLQEKQRLIAKAGGKMMLFLPPVMRSPRITPDPGYGKDIPVFNFSDPREYPNLFLRENRLDSGHLNGPGSEIFTRLLAEQFVRSSRDRR